MELNESNFLLYAARFYDNPNCSSILEFEDDLRHFKYLKRLFNRYVESGDLKERLILNHITIIYNLFGAAATPMLFLKLQGLESILKPFLITLGRMPELIEVCGNKLRNSDISMDQEVVETLRKI